MASATSSDTIANALPPCPVFKQPAGEFTKEQANALNAYFNELRLHTAKCINLYERLLKYAKEHIESSKRFQTKYNDAVRINGSLHDEISTLKAEIERHQTLSDDATRMTTPFKVRPFSGEKGDDDWPSWRANFEKVCKGNGWQDNIAKAALYIAMKGRAARATRNIKELETDKLGDLLKKFEKVFMPESATAYAMSLFQLARQEEGESALDWHTRVGDLYQRAYPDVADPERSPELILRFCHGFRDKNLVFRMYNPKPETFSDALNKAQADEASRHIASDGKGNAPSNIGRINAMDATEGLLAALGLQPSCWHCGDNGHLKRDCPQRQRALGHRRQFSTFRPVQTRPVERRPIPSQFQRGATGGANRGNPPMKERIRQWYGKARQQINALEEVDLLEAEEEEGGEEYQYVEPAGEGVASAEEADS